MADNSIRTRSENPPLNKSDAYSSSEKKSEDTTQATREEGKSNQVKDQSDSNNKAAKKAFEAEPRLDSDSDLKTQF